MPDFLLPTEAVRYFGVPLYYIDGTQHHFNTFSLIMTYTDFAASSGMRNPADGRAGQKVLSTQRPPPLQDVSRTTVGQPRLPTAERN